MSATETQAPTQQTPAIDQEIEEQFTYRITGSRPPGRCHIAGEDDVDVFALYVCEAREWPVSREGRGSDDIKSVPRGGAFGERKKDKRAALSQKQGYSKLRPRMQKRSGYGYIGK